MVDSVIQSASQQPVWLIGPSQSWSSCTFHDIYYRVQLYESSSKGIKELEVGHLLVKVLLHYRELSAQLTTPQH